MNSYRIYLLNAQERIAELTARIEQARAEYYEHDAPTLTEAGIDLTFTNWRGVLAPPGISDDARDAMVRALTDLHGTDQWKEALVRNG